MGIISIDADGKALDPQIVRCVTALVELHGQFTDIPQGTVAEWVMGEDQAAQWENASLIVASIKPTPIENISQLGRRHVATMAGIPIRRVADFPAGCVSLRVGEREIAAISGLTVPATYGIEGAQ